MYLGWAEVIIIPITTTDRISILNILFFVMLISIENPTAERRHTAIPKKGHHLFGYNFIGSMSAITIIKVIASQERDMR